MTQRSAEAPSVVSHLSLLSGKPLATALERGRGETDLRRGGVELRRRRLTGGEGERRLTLIGEGDLIGLLAGEGERLLTGEIDLRLTGVRALRLTGVKDLRLTGVRDLRMGGGDTDSFRGEPDLRLAAGETDLPPRLVGLRDRRSTSYLGAPSIMTESPE